MSTRTTSASRANAARGRLIATGGATSTISSTCNGAKWGTVRLRLGSETVLDERGALHAVQGTLGVPVRAIRKCTVGFEPEVLIRLARLARLRVAAGVERVDAELVLAVVDRAQGRASDAAIAERDR